jgi:uncharacterized membrane protein
MSWQNTKDLIRLGYNVASILLGPLFAMAGGMMVWLAALEQGKHQSPANMVLVLIGSVFLYTAVYGLTDGIHYTPHAWRMLGWLLLMLLGIAILKYIPASATIRIPMIGMCWAWSLYLFWYNDQS